MEITQITVPASERRAVARQRFKRSAKEFITHYSRILYNYSTANPQIAQPSELSKLDMALEFLLAKKGANPVILFDDVGWPSPRTYVPLARQYSLNKLFFDVTILRDSQRVYIIFDFTPGVYVVFGYLGNSIPFADDTLRFNERRMQILSDQLHSRLIDRIQTGNWNAIRMPKFIETISTNMCIKSSVSDCDPDDMIKTNLYDRLGNVDSNWNHLQRLFVALIFLLEENLCEYVLNTQQPINYILQPYHGQVVEMKRVDLQFYVSLVEAPLSVFIMFANSQRRFVHGYRLLLNWIPEFFDDGLCISNDNNRLQNLNNFLGSAIIAFSEVEKSTAHSRRSSFSDDGFSTFMSRHIGLDMEDPGDKNEEFEFNMD